MRILLPSLLLLATACTPTARDMDRQADAQAGARSALDEELVGLVPDRPQACVQTRLLQGGLAAYGDTLVYRVNAREKYVNRTSGGCEQVANDSYLVTRTPSTQLCRGDIATAVSRTSNVFSGSCGLGDFVRYSRP